MSAVRVESDLFMKFRRPSRCLTLLAAVLFFAGQGQAWVRGFVCDCSGEMEWTRSDHCAGPHGTACHAEEPDHESHSHPEDEAPADRRDHTPWIEWLVARLSSPTDASTLWMSVQPSCPPLWETVIVLPERKREPDWVPERGGGGGSGDPWPLRLSTVICLRV